MKQNNRNAKNFSRNKAHLIQNFTKWVSQPTRAPLGTKESNWPGVHRVDWWSLDNTGVSPPLPYQLSLHRQSVGERKGNAHRHALLGNVIVKLNDSSDWWIRYFCSQSSFSLTPANLPEYEGWSVTKPTLYTTAKCACTLLSITNFFMHSCWDDRKMPRSWSRNDLYNRRKL